MELKGIAASNGIVIANAYRLEQRELVVEKRTVTDKAAEQQLFKMAVEKSHTELKAIRDHTIQAMDEAHGAIFEAHIQMLLDPEFQGAVLGQIENQECNAGFALQTAAAGFVALFDAIEDPYLRERAADVKDVTRRVLSHIEGVALNDPSSICEAVVVVADDLTPSDTAQLNKQYVQGFVTCTGGRTSHSAIMARSLEIPAVVGVPEALEQIEQGTAVILDGIAGVVLVDPSPEQRAHYQQKAQAYAEQKQRWAQLKDTPTRTKEGHRVELAANIGSPADVEAVLNNGAEGIGLYRTEFLYMGRDTFPTEEEQFQAYKAVLEAMKGKPVVIRTLDIGGDKELPYMEMPTEQNPFLGHRAIRLCLENQELFKTQLRALLRASVHGNLKIMFPMIATLEEFRAARQVFVETRQQLIGEGVAVNNAIELGIMVEIPAAALLAHQFAKEVDFFSIGTNDLIQYTFAADRMNQKVAYLYQPYHPSLLQLIKMVVDAAHSQGKWAGMCGEMAGDLTAIPLLLGLGLDEFSMSASSILPARERIQTLNTPQMQALAQKALELSSHSEVEAWVRQSIEEGQQ